MATAIKGKKGFVKLKPSEKKTIRKTLFFTIKDHKEIEQKAEELSLSVAEYMRFKILNKIG